MYVFMYAFIYVFMYVCIYVSLYVCIYLCLYICTHLVQERLTCSNSECYDRNELWAVMNLESKQFAEKSICKLDVNDN